MFFTKPEYKEMMLPFTYDDNEEELDAGIFYLELYGYIFDGYKYCSVSYLTKTDYPEQLAECLRSHAGEAVRVVFKIKKGKVKDVKIDLDHLAQICRDARFKDMEVIGCGYDVKSIEEVKKEMIGNSRCRKN